MNRDKSRVGRPLSVDPGPRRDAVREKVLITRGQAAHRKGKSGNYGQEVGMKQESLFDGKLSDKLKQHGMEQAEDNALSALELGRQIADRLARTRGPITADDVGRVLRRDHGIETLGPAAGSLFKGSKWAFTGRWVKSKRIKNHSRMLREWRLL